MVLLKYNLNNVCDPNRARKPHQGSAQRTMIILIYHNISWLSISKFLNNVPKSPIKTQYALSPYYIHITEIMRIACVLKAYFSPILYSLQRLSNDFRYDMCRFSLSKSPVKPRDIPVLPRSLRFYASKQFDFFPSDNRATYNVILEYFRPRKEEAIQIFNSPPILRRLQPLLPMHLLRRWRASPALPQAVP